MKNFLKLENPSSWRKLSIANWRAPNDPTVYGHLSINFSKGLSFLEKINQNTEAKITVTHVVAKALALALRKFPDLNGVIKWNQIYLRQSVDIFLQVSIDGESDGTRPDLSGAKITHCDQKDLKTIALELKNQCARIRSKDDPHFKKSINLLNLVPPILLPYFLKFMTFVIFILGLDLPQMGLPTDPFGSAMVTSVGMFKMPPGFAPLVPMSRVPLIVCVGAITDKPIAENGQVVIRPMVERL